MTCVSANQNAVSLSVHRYTTGCMKGIPADRRRYTAGKKVAYEVPFYVTKEQKQEIMAAVTEDVALFEAGGCTRLNPVDPIA
jgi:hypothetical protein